MPEKYYRLPVSNSVIKLSSICNVSYVEKMNEEETFFGFFVEYDQQPNITKFFPFARDADGNKIFPDWMEYNIEQITGNSKVKLESYRADLISAMTENNAYVDNFPGE